MGSRLVLVVLLMSLLIGVVPSAASAAEKDKQKTAGASAKVFKPGKPNRTPVGGPIPESAGKDAKKLGSEVPEGAKEVAANRTEFSRTFSTREGVMFTQFSEEPLNYQDAEGEWKAIDNKLVAQANGRGFRNTAGPVKTELPKDLSARPARLESKGNFVEFTLKGASKPSKAKSEAAPPETPASAPAPAVAETPAPAPEPEPSPTPSPTGATSPVPAPQSDDEPDQEAARPQTSPSPGDKPEPATPTDEALPPQASSASFTIAAAAPTGQTGMDLLIAPSGNTASVEGETATYLDVFDGVDINYTSLGTGLKEEIVLAGPDVPLSYDFTLRLSPASKAVPNTNGGIDLVDASGAVWAQVARPFAYDATVADRSPAEGMNLNEVKLELISEGADPVMRLSVQESWILDPSRSFPVVLDPTVILPGAYQTTTTPSAPNDNFSGLGWTAIYGHSAPWRALAKPQADLASFFKEPVEVVSAAFDMGVLIDSTGQPAYPVGAYEVTSRWYNSTATWNQRAPGVNWGVPGGDIAAQPDAVNPNVTGGTLGARTWWITDLVQDWANGTKAYNGLIIRYVNEAQPAPVIYFDNSKTSMTIWWLPRTETADPYPHASFNLGERRTAAVSLAAGSLEVRETDVSLSGVAGMDLALTRRYSSRGGYTNGLLGWGTGMGWGWSLEVPRLTAFTDGGAIITGMPEGTLHFGRSFPGTYRSPKAFRGELALWVNGAYVLTMHDTGAQMVFGSTGHLAWIWDRNQNQNDLQNPNDNQWILFNYTYSQYLVDYLLTSITDTRGQTTTITRPADQEPISKIVDPFGRTHQYGYSGDASNGYRMTSYTDPAGKVTHYDYTALPPGPHLNKITDQVGNQTRISYTQAPSLIGPVPTGGMQTAGTTYRATSLVRVTDNSAGTGPTYGMSYLGRTVGRHAI